MYTECDARNYEPKNQVPSHDIMTSYIESEACPILRGYVVKSGKKLQNLDLSSFPVDVFRMFVRNHFQISLGLQGVTSQKIVFFSHSRDQLKYQLSLEKVICQNSTSICFYVGLFVCVIVCVCLFVCVCMCVYVCVFVYLYSYSCDF
jgi:hypothetical protein